jgi:N-carbamoylputrescine amidase
MDQTLTAERVQINLSGVPSATGPASRLVSPSLDVAGRMKNAVECVTRLLPENGTHVMSEHRRPFNVGLIQMRCSTDTTDNLTRACSLLRQAAERGAQVVCLPELFGTQYFCQVEDAARFDLAEPIPGPTTEALADVARTCGIVVVGSIFERRAAGIYHNTAVVLDADGTLRGRYRKMHIPDDPLYYEKYYFTPGDLGFQTFDTSFARMGTLVCWDQWYPEAARLTALQGAEILFYPTAIGWHPAEKAEFGEAQTSAWATIQRSHAIANGVYVAAVNRVGHEGPAGGGLEFWGGSFVADPFGRLIAEAGRDGEEIVIARCDPRLQEETRRNWPFLRDRRIDAYAPITQRFLDRREP